MGDEMAVCKKFPLYSLAIYLSTMQLTLAADCKKALEVVFAHEGGYQNSSKDAGNWSGKKVGSGFLCGGTKYGIACGHNPGVNIKDLTLEKASEIYEKQQCVEIRMEELKGQWLPTLMLDLTINMGARATIGLIANTVNILNEDKDHIDIPDKMSDEIVKWYNYYNEDGSRKKLFYAVLTLTAIDRYARIVENNKNQSVWLLGWIRRVIPNEIEEITNKKISNINKNEIIKEASIISDIKLTKPINNTSSPETDKKKFTASNSGSKTFKKLRVKKAGKKNSNYIYRNKIKKSRIKKYIQKRR